MTISSKELLDMLASAPKQTQDKVRAQTVDIAGPVDYRLECELVRDVLLYLRARGFLAWRNNTGAVAEEASGNSKRRFIRYGAPGSGDVFGILPGGRFISVECKVRGRKPTVAQQDWMECIRAAGGVAGVVHDLQELAQLIKGV